MNRERLDVLERLPASPAVAAERTDALFMVTQSMIRAGELREALRWDQINASEIAESAPHIAAAHSIPPLYLLGEWDTALERGATMRSSWEAEGRPPFVPFSPSLAAVGAIHGFRGNEPACRDWVELAEQVASDSQQRPGVRLMIADVAVHFGDLERAAALLSDLGPPSFWWRDPVMAQRAEVLARLGHPDAPEAVAALEARRTDDPFMSAVTFRARAALTGDHELLREAAAAFDQLECVYAAAYTRWLIGGDERDTAREEFTRLGAVIPA